MVKVRVAYGVSFAILYLISLAVFGSTTDGMRLIMDRIDTC